MRQGLWKRRRRWINKDELMKRFLLALAVLFTIGLAAPAMAVNCDSLSVTGLPDAAVIELKKKCVEVTKNESITPDVSNIAEYAELGKKYGIALSEVAKSIGVTVNELAQTPVGKFMLVMVAYKVMGNDLIGIVGGVVWFSTMIPLWIFIFYKLVFSTRKIVERFNDAGKLISREKLPLDYTNSNTGVVAFFMGVFMVAICISGFLMVFG